MPVFRDTVMIRDRPFNRAVKVTITAPDVSKFQPNSDEVQALAQKAWRSINRKITIGEITVKVAALGSKRTKSDVAT